MIHPSTHPFRHFSIRLSIYPSIRPSFHPSILLSRCFLIRSFVRLHFHFPQCLLSPGLSLYLLSRKHFSDGTVHCFLQQNKSFGFDLQHNLEPIIGVQNWFKRYAQLNTLTVFYIFVDFSERCEIPAEQTVI